MRADNLIGDCRILIPDLLLLANSRNSSSSSSSSEESPAFIGQQFPIDGLDLWEVLHKPVGSEKGLPQKLGKKMSEEGWKPKLPLVIVPGFGSSSLVVVKSEMNPSWEGDRLWISLGKIGKEKLSRIVRRKSKANEILDSESPSS